MEGILRAHEKKQVARGLSLLIEADIQEAKDLIENSEIKRALAKLKDARDLMQRANKLEYFPLKGLRIKASRYNRIVFSPSIQNSKYKSILKGFEINLEIRAQHSKYEQAEASA